jgi:hypothetical protein
MKNRKEKEKNEISRRVGGKEEGWRRIEEEV